MNKKNETQTIRFIIFIEYPAFNIESNYNIQVQGNIHMYQCILCNVQYSVVLVILK